MVLLLALAACTSPGKRTAIGAGAGAGAGAAMGGAVGGWKGAGIGAIVGAATGGAVGNYLDKQHKELEKVVDTKRLKDGLLVNLKNDLLFDVDQADLRGNAIPQLNELGAILSKYEQDRIRIAGFTDDSGSNDHNKELSERRAQAVRDVLKANGVRDEQLLIQGFGESKPVASNKTNTGRQKNRRVEILIDVPADNQAAIETTNGRVPASK